jgi:hypothetical protein
MEVSGQFHDPTALPPGKNTWCPLHRRLGGPQSRSGHCSEDKNSLLLSGLESPIIQLVAIYPRVERPGREADHSPPHSARVKNVWSYTSTCPYIFTTWCLIRQGIHEHDNEPSDFVRVG